MSVPQYQDAIQTKPYGKSGHGQKTDAFVGQVPAGLHGLKIRKWLIGGGALILVLGGFWYHNSFSGSGAQRGPRVQSAPVRAATASRGDMAVIEHTIGTVIPNTAVQVSARVQGVIDAAPFKEGQFVKKGDLLFQIDPRSFQAALAQARATLAKDQAQLVDDRNNEIRYKTLIAQNATSSQLLDSAVATADSQAAIVDADKAAVQMAELNLDYTQIRSPVDGKTGPILVQPGNMVAANGTTALVTINQIQPIKISFSLPQTDLPRIQARARANGLEATIDQSASGGKTISAPVDFVSNAVTNTSGTIELRSTFDNADAALVPGQLVNVVVELADIPAATLVPHDAVNTGPNGQFVYTVTPENKALEKDVTVLFDDGTNAALQGDVKPGDRVITDGQLRVVPGATVFVEGARPGAAAAGAGGKGVKGKGGKGKGGKGRASAGQDPG